MADLQSTNRTKVSKTRESTFGVIPNNPPFKEMRTTSSSLNANPQTTVTSEIRSDRQVADLILVGQQAGGDIGGELSYKTHDDDLEEACQGTWSNKAVRDNNGSADSVVTAVTASSDTYTVLDAAVDFKPGDIVLASGFGQALNNSLFVAESGTNGTSVIAPSSPGLADEAAPAAAARLKCVGFQGASGDIEATTDGGNALISTSLDFQTLGLAAGEWFKIGSGVTDTGFATGANNGWARISAIAQHRISLDVVPAGFTTDDGASKTIRLFFGDVLRNGTTKRSNTIERQYLDHSPASYEYFRGMVLNTLSLTFEAQSIVTMARGYMGRDSYLPDPMGRVSGAADTAAPTNDVLNTSSNIGDIIAGGAPITGPNYVLQASIEINNNLRQQNAIGSIGAVGIGVGEFGVTGSLQTYFGNPDEYRKVSENTATSLALRCGRSDGNREMFIFDLPRIKYSGGAPGISGKNADVPLEGQYQAIMHPTLGYTIGIQRFDYLPA
ncbi:MAG: phage tail tube protein [Vicinamibacterales bacterium]